MDHDDESESLPGDIPGDLGLGHHLDGTIQDDVMEIYSVPRVVPVAIAAGLRGDLSIDLKSGQNLREHIWQDWEMKQIRARRPKVVI